MMKILFSTTLAALCSLSFAVIASRPLSSSDLMPLNIFHQSGNGQTYFVDSQHSSKSDSNAGTESLPFATLAHGISVLSPGDALYVKGGSYYPTDDMYKNLQIEKSGTSSDYILISAYPGHRPKIYVDTMNGVQIWNSAYIEFKGFEVYGMNDPSFVNPDDRRQNGNGISIFGNIGNKHIRIIDNHVHHVGGNGIGVSTSDQVLIKGNRIWHCTHRSRNGNSGISITHPKDHVSTSGYGVVVTGNEMYDNVNKYPFKYAGIITDGNGIIFDYYAQNGDRNTYSKRMLAVNNIAHHNGGRCLHTFNFHDVDFVHNSCFSNLRTTSLASGHGELSFANAAGIRVYNNAVYATNAAYTLTFFTSTPEAEVNNNVLFGGSKGVFNNGVLIQNTITGNPSYVSPSTNFNSVDLRLTKGSAAINVANPLLVSCINQDFDGVSRPQGSAPDVGAFEYKEGRFEASPSPTSTATLTSTPTVSTTPLPSESTTPATSPIPTRSPSPTVSSSNTAIPSPQSNNNNGSGDNNAPNNGGLDSYMPSNKVRQSGNGNTYIVDTNHPSANDNTNLGTLDKPFKTIGKGVSVLKAGDTLYVRSGDYRPWDSDLHNLHIQLKGTADDYIIISGYPGDSAPVIHTTTTNGIQIFSSHYLEFSGFEISGVGGWGNPGNCVSLMGNPGNRYIRFINNYVHDCRGGGIVSANGDYVLVAKNEVVRCTTSLPYAGGAITVSSTAYTGSPYGVVIAANKIVHQTDYENANGIFFNWYGAANTRPALVVNNIIYGFGGRCICTFKSYNVDIIHNTCLGNIRNSGLRQWAGEISVFYQSEGVRLYNNIIRGVSAKFAITFHHGSTGEAKTNVLFGATAVHNDGNSISGSIEQNPLFKSESISSPDLNLKSGSPAIDAADSALGAQVIAVDLIGNIRPKGTAPDVGAYEAA